jgi:protein-disulfide isomerase/uncharacterized membrane protein
VDVQTRALPGTEDLVAGRRRARVALAACILLCLVGLGISWDLTRVWVMSRTDPDYHSFCAVSEAMNCETVALSNWSSNLGAPNSIWAMAGYVFAIVLAGLAASRKRDALGFGLLVLLGCGFVVVSMGLLFVMHAMIGSMCILCLALDLVNASLLAFAIVASRAVGSGTLGAIVSDIAVLVRRPLFGLILVMTGVALLGSAWAVGHQVARKTGASAAGFASLVPKTVEQNGPACVAGASTESSGPSMGISPDGHQWIGAANPVVEVQEFTDYQCPHCRRAHMMVRRLLATAGSKVRVYHRHLPLDQACNPSIGQPFHGRACELSRVALCAGRQGRFWEMSDLLFQQADEIREKDLSAKELAGRLELDQDAFLCCLDEAATKEAVARDVAEAGSLGIKGTPAFVIGGTVYYGKIPAEALEAAGITVQ